jgi:hypothetical protein
MRKGGNCNIMEMVLEVNFFVVSSVLSCLFVVLSEVLTDVTVASMNSHSNSRHEASRQSAGWESPGE